MGVYTGEEILEMGQQHRPGRDATATPATNIDAIIKEHREEKADDPKIVDAEIVEDETEEKQTPELSTPGCPSCDGRGVVEETNKETGEMSKGPCPDCSKS